MTNEEILTEFMQRHYTDERLAQLLAHAEDGKLNFSSCCCFIGIVTATHALQSESRWLLDDTGVAVDHLELARTLDGASRAERAFLDLGDQERHAAFMRGEYPDGNQLRRTSLIPLIRAEIERRDAERSESKSSLLTVSV